MGLQRIQFNIYIEELQRSKKNSLSFFNIKKPLMGDLRFDTQGASQVYKRQFFIDQHIETKNKFRFRDKTWNKLAVIKWFLKNMVLKLKSY